MEVTIKQALQQAIAAHKKGELSEAGRIYRVILQSQPKHPDANHNLGVIAISANQAASALPLFKTALEANPNVEQFWLSYIDALIKTNHIRDAKKTLKKAKNRGIEAQKLAKQISKLQQANGTNTSDQRQLDRLMKLYENGRYVDAERLAKSITQKFPTNQFVWKVLGATLVEVGRQSEALNAYQTAITLLPSDAEAHYNLGIALQALGRLNEAETSYKKAVALKPDFAEAHNNLGITQQELGKVIEAEASYNHVIEVTPNDAEAHNNLGVALSNMGRLKEAEISYQRAIALKHDLAEAHRHLAKMKKFDVQDERYLKMREIYLDKNISDEQRCHINFGLAKACEDLKNFDQAFVHYTEGNMLRKKMLNYDIQNDAEELSLIKRTNDQIKSCSLRAEEASQNLTPIFILGMPRSGTTLVEQIISSHPQVTGAGELVYVEKYGRAIATGFSDVNTDSLLTFRHKYLEKLKDRSDGNLIVTDKMPQNFRYIGLLAATFPEAKIVHVTRLPAAVCWANYTTYFASSNLGYSYSIADIVKYHKLYKDLMEFWTSNCFDRIYQLDYELLTNSQDSQTRQLIDYLGLDWNEECLSPENNTRPVATQSNVQVRKRVYKGSSEQWKKYEPFLNGEFDRL